MIKNNVLNQTRSWGLKILNNKIIYRFHPFYYQPVNTQAAAQSFLAAPANLLLTAQPTSATSAASLQTNPSSTLPQNPALSTLTSLNNAGLFDLTAYTTQPLNGSNRASPFESSNHLTANQSAFLQFNQTIPTSINNQTTSSVLTASQAATTNANYITLPQQHITFQSQLHDRI